MNENEDLMKLFVEKANVSMRRVRWIQFAIIIVSISIIPAIWNTYLSWNRNVIKASSDTKNEVVKNTTTELTKNWVESTYINFSFVGVKVSSSDIAFLTSLGITVLVICLYYSTRTVNHLLAETFNVSSGYSVNQKRYIYYGIIFSSAFSTWIKSDDPVKDLKELNTIIEIEKSKQKFKLVRFIISMFYFYPGILILIILLFDILSISSFDSLFRGNFYSVIQSIHSSGEWIQIICTDVFALLLSSFCFIIGNSVKKFNISNTDLIMKYNLSIQIETNS